jgi:hypothetical protein
MKLLKFISVLLISTTLFVSCGPNKPDNKVYGTKTEQTGFKPGPTVNDKPVAVVDTFVQISPTWGQANHYASERKDFAVWQIIGWVLLAAFAVAVYGKATEASWFPNVNPTSFNLILFVLLAGSISSFKWQSSSIKWNNDKWVKKEVFDKAIQETGTTQPIWDSLRSECRIVFGPYECFNK